MLLQRPDAYHSPAPALNNIFLYGRQSHPGGSSMPAQLEQSLFVLATPASHQTEVALQQQQHVPAFNTTGDRSFCACSVMVLKKLGDGLTEEFHKVVEYLGIEQSMQVVVEPHEHQKMVWPSCC